MPFKKKVLCQLTETWQFSEWNTLFVFKLDVQDLPEDLILVPSSGLEPVSICSLLIVNGTPAVRIFFSFFKNDWHAENVKEANLLTLIRLRSEK